MMYQNKHTIELHDIVAKWRSNTPQSNRSMKNHRPSKKSKFKQGYYDISESLKYSSDESCIYRSSLEYKIMLWLETNPNIVAWVSEPFSVPYKLNDKQKNYNIDFICLFRDGRIWFIEGKPYGQTLPYSYGWDMNKAKWNAAIEWCSMQQENVQFQIITERFNFYV